MIQFFPCVGREQADCFGETTPGPTGNWPHASGPAGEPGGAGQAADNVLDG